jgi:hypothetical protein
MITSVAIGAIIGGSTSVHARGSKRANHTVIRSQGNEPNRQAWQIDGKFAGMIGREFPGNIFQPEKPSKIRIEIRVPFLFETMDLRMRGFIEASMSPFFISLSFSLQ